MEDQKKMTAEELESIRQRIDEIMDRLAEKIVASGLDMIVLHRPLRPRAKRDG